MSCVDEPECNSKFLGMVTQMKHLFFFLYHIMQNKFCKALTISAVLHEFQSSEGGPNCILQLYAPHY